MAKVTKAGASTPRKRGRVWTLAQRHAQRDRMLARSKAGAPAPDLTIRDQLISDINGLLRGMSDTALVRFYRETVSR